MNVPGQQKSPNTANSVVVRMAQKYGVEADKILTTLKETCFKGNVSTEQLIALMIVAEQYGLNPWLREIYAFPAQGGGIVPIVGVDGWTNIVNSQPTLKSMSFNYSEEEDKGIPIYIECLIERTDRTAPIVAREYFAECYRETSSWKSHPRRMLRHKAFVQAARLAYGFSGIYDPDEGERIIDGVATEVTNRKPSTETPVERKSEEPARIERKPEEPAHQPEGLVEDAPPMRKESVKLARPNQLKLLREVIGKHQVDEDQVCLHFDVAKLEDLEFDTVDVALIFIKGKQKAQP